MFSFVSSYNATTDQDTVVCLYPISGHYEATQRFLYYGLLLFAFFARRQVWLISGAVAAALTYSGTAAVHSIVLAAASRASLLDLDSLGAWAVLSAACIIMLPGSEFSKTLRESPARPVFKFWGFLVAVGIVCSEVALFHRYPDEPACVSSDGEPLTGPSQGLPASNCTYSCFSTSQPLRPPSQITAMVKGTVLGSRGHDLLAALILTDCFLIYSFAVFLISVRKRTEATIHADIADNEPYLFDPECGEIVKAEAARNDRRPSTGGYQIHPCLELLGRTSPLFFIAVVCLNEVSIFAGGGFPFAEPVYTIGQWSSCVSVLLVIIASAITYGYKPVWEERQGMLKREQAALEAHGIRAA
jgi:hypothetical protein